RRSSDLILAYCCKLLAILSLLPISLEMYCIINPAINKFIEKKNMVNFDASGCQSKISAVNEPMNKTVMTTASNKNSLLGLTIADDVQFLIAASSCSVVSANCANV